jgi:transcriptional regulator with GAF, ATPase, and Fis domain
MCCQSALSRLVNFPVPNGEQTRLENNSRDPAAAKLALPDALPPVYDLTQYLEGLERQLIMNMLTTPGGVQAEAARRMGLSRSAFAYKLTKYGISLRESGV